jgi:hypothetical protein
VLISENNKFCAMGQWEEEKLIGYPEAFAGSEVPKYPKNCKEGSKWATVLNLVGSDNCATRTREQCFWLMDEGLETRQNERRPMKQIAGNDMHLLRARS